MLKFVRDLEIYKDDEERWNKFLAINEAEDDLNYQRRIQIILQDIDLKGALVEHTNKYYGQIEGIYKLKE